MLVLSAQTGGALAVSGGSGAQAAATRQRNQLTQIQKLAQTDRVVRAHEQAHLAAAGSYARGGANFTYQTGPDGKQYAVGGEVSIDTSPESDPQKTIGKARVIQAAANAPANPSSQDRAVAAAASQMEASAHQQLAAQQRAKVAEAYGKGDSPLQGSLLSLFA